MTIQLVGEEIFPKNVIFSKNVKYDFVVWIHKNMGSFDSFHSNQ